MDVLKTFVKGTLVVLVIAWLVTHGSDVAAIISSLGGAWTASITSLRPAKG